MLFGQNTLERVCIALRNSGYDPEGITSAQYRGISLSGEVHRITFEDLETGDQAEGRVYITQDNGMLKGEF